MNYGYQAIDISPKERLRQQQFFMYIELLLFIALASEYGRIYASICLAY